MMTYKDWKERVIRWLTWAAFFSCIGCILHFTNIIPVNKKLWYVSKKKKRILYKLEYRKTIVDFRSLSFVFVTTSFSLAFLSACYLLVDVIKVWNGGPFRIPGTLGSTFTQLCNSEQVLRQNNLIPVYRLNSIGKKSDIWFINIITFLYNLDLSSISYLKFFLIYLVLILFVQYLILS